MDFSARLLDPLQWRTTTLSSPLLRCTPTSPSLPEDIGALVEKLEARRSDLQSYVLIDLTYALIRWYSPKHQERVKEIIKFLEDKPHLDQRQQTRANLRLALWYWHPDSEDDQITKEEDGKIRFKLFQKHES